MFMTWIFATSQSPRVAYFFRGPQQDSNMRRVKYAINRGRLTANYLALMFHHKSNARFVAHHLQFDLHYFYV